MPLIKVVKSSNSRNWYHDLIGHVFYGWDSGHNRGSMTVLCSPDTELKHYLNWDDVPDDVYPYIYFTILKEDIVCLGEE